MKADPMAQINSLHPYRLSRRTKICTNNKVSFKKLLLNINYCKTMANARDD